MGRSASPPGTSTCWVVVMIVPLHVTALLAWLLPPSSGRNQLCGPECSDQSPGGRYQEAAEGTQQRDHTGTEESDAITGHDGPAGRRRERNQKCDTDDCPHLSCGVEYAGSHAAVGRLRGISSGLGRGD